MTKPVWARWLIIGAVAIFLLRAAACWGTVVDDAYISARYAANLAAGHGLVFNAGELPVEGYTNLIWTVMLAGVHLLGLPVHASMEGLGLGFGVLGIIGIWKAAEVMLPAETPAWVPLVPAYLLASTPHYAVVATNGLETTQFIAWSMWALWATFGLRGSGRWLAAVVIGTLGWVRPEGAAVAGGIVLIDGIANRKHWKQVWFWAPAIGLVAGMSLLFGWRYATYEALVPNTGPAKANMTWSGALKKNFRYLSPDGEVWLLAGLFAMIGGLASPRGWSKVLLGCLTLGLTMIAIRVYLWMPGGRLLVLPLALALMLSAWPLASGLQERRRLKMLWLAVLGVFAVYQVVGDPTGLLRLTGSRGSPTARWHAWDQHHSVVSPNDTLRVGQHLAAHLPAGSRLATRDAGLLAWSVGTEMGVDELHERALTLPHPNYENIDFRTLIQEPSEVVAFTVASEKKKPFYYPRERRIWGHLSPQEYVYYGRVKQHYRRHYDIYVRADIPIPALPEGTVVNYVGVLPRTTIFGSKTDRVEQR